jgi:hypothetical protein
VGSSAVGTCLPRFAWLVLLRASFIGTSRVVRRGVVSRR